MSATSEGSDGTVTTGYLAVAQVPTEAAPTGLAETARPVVGAPHREQSPAPAAAGRDHLARPAEGRSRRSGRRAAVILAGTVIVISVADAILATTSPQPRLATTSRQSRHVPGHTLIPALTDPTSAETDPSSAGVSSVAFSPDGETIATGDSNGSTYLRDASGGTLIATLTDPTGGSIDSVAFSPDGKTIATSDANGNTYLWQSRGFR